MEKDEILEFIEKRVTQLAVRKTKSSTVPEYDEGRYDEAVFILELIKQPRMTEHSSPHAGGPIGLH